MQAVIRHGEERGLYEPVSVVSFRVGNLLLFLLRLECRQLVRVLRLVWIRCNEKVAEFG